MPLRPVLVCLPRSEHASMRVSTVANPEPKVQGLRPGREVMTRQHLPYFIGISGSTVNARGAVDAHRGHFARRTRCLACGGKSLVCAAGFATVRPPLARSRRCASATPPSRTSCSTTRRNRACRATVAAQRPPGSVGAREATAPDPFRRDAWCEAGHAGSSRLPAIRSVMDRVLAGWAIVRRLRPRTALL
jgi:hypothetical protein